jgi:ATP phosphoribosyltransferase
LRANKLRIVTTLCESTTQFIANKKAVQDAWKKTKMDQLVLLLRGAIEAQSMVGLKLNVHRKNLDQILHLLSSLKNPTISHLSDDHWLAVEAVIHEEKVRSLIPQLKMAGGQGIIEYPLNKIIL